MKTSNELFDMAERIVDQITDETEITIGELKIVGLLIKELMDDYLDTYYLDTHDENYICPDCEAKMMGEEKNGK